LQEILFIYLLITKKAIDIETRYIQHKIYTNPELKVSIKNPWTECHAGNLWGPIQCYIERKRINTDAINLAL